MREIVLDTETTGLDPKTGDRLVEIGCVEIVNRFVTGAVFHRYLNPQRPMPVEAFRVHGLSEEFLADKPLFADVVDDFLAFIGEAPLVIHNASFDMAFINHELSLIRRPAIGMDRVVDSLAVARRRHPGASNSLDALCQRYGIDRSKRTFHGALLDSELLALVYAELMGGRQSTLLLDQVSTEQLREARASLGNRTPRVVLASEEERAGHAAFIATLSGTPLWASYDVRAEPEAETARG